MNKYPFFSIVIPTRQRHETLGFAIRTVLEQKFDNYEIIVCDNLSSSETKEVVDNLNNSKIKYIRTDSLLSMTDNWEFALSKAKGEYVIIFGDDDGMINGSLEFLYELIEKTNFSVIRWERVIYEWNNSAIKEFSNKLDIPLCNQSKIEQGINVINKVINFKTAYTKLPMLYNSAVKRSLLIDLKKLTGRYFLSVQPDIYSGFAIAYLSKEYLSIGIPLSINGGSAKSNGAATMKKSNSISEEFNNLNSATTIKQHAKIPNIRSMPAYIADAFFQFSDNLNPVGVTYTNNNIMNKIVEEMIIFDEEESQEYLKKINNLKDNSEIVNKFKKKEIIFKTQNYEKYKIGVIGNHLTLDAMEFNWSNVLDISKFSANFYVYSVEAIFEEIQKNKIQLFKERLKKAIYTSAKIIRGY